ncbi:hypothetical protein [Thermosinus carboxydivorans]|nr:hypothetical protein [Thermosinus carboxydivorans]
MIKHGAGPTAQSANQAAEAQQGNLRVNGHQRITRNKAKEQH